jgi:tetratricopeptide (TPR) repeat protein
MSQHRLDSWKEIAAYLQRTERTVRRWETLEGLPVHRLHHEKRGSVYAYAHELDAWLQSRSLKDTTPHVEESDSIAPLPASNRSTRRWALATAVATLVVVALIVVVNRGRSSASTSNPEVARDVARANYASPGRAQIASAIEYDQQAIRLDPNYALAWARLGVSHVALAWFGESPGKETMAQAQVEAREALRLDPSLSEAWRVLAWTSHYLDWDQKTAEREFQRAIQLDPRNEGALFWYSEFLLEMRRFDEAAVYSRRAQDAAPRWLMPVVGAGNIQMMSGHVELALPEYQRALALDPNFGVAYEFLGLAHLKQGRSDEALGELQKANELLGHVPFSLGGLGYGLGVTGRHVEAEAMLADLLHRRDGGYYPAFPIAQIELGLGRSDVALDWLERAAVERHVGYYFPTVDPMYDPVRTNPRFVRIVAHLLPE